MFNAFVYIAEKIAACHLERQRLVVGKLPACCEVNPTIVTYVFFSAASTLLCRTKVSNVSSGLKMACFDSCVLSARHDGVEGIEFP